MAGFDRGFKAWCERTSHSLRRDMGLGLLDPVEPSTLARSLDVTLWTPRDVPGLPKDVLDQLLVHDPGGWSAVTLMREGAPLVIHNPRHSRARQTSDITHELSHILLGHKPSNKILSADGSLVLRGYDAKQEGEADWFAGTLLLPREALLHYRRERWDDLRIADHFNVSLQLATYRLRITGVNSQLRASGAVRRKAVK